MSDEPLTDPNDPAEVSAPEKTTCRCARPRSSASGQW